MGNNDSYIKSPQRMHELLRKSSDTSDNNLRLQNTVIINDEVTQLAETKMQTEYLDQKIVLAVLFPDLGKKIQKIEIEIGTRIEEVSAFFTELNKCPKSCDIIFFKKMSPNSIPIPPHATLNDLGLKNGSLIYGYVRNSYRYEESPRHSSSAYSLKVIFPGHKGKTAVIKVDSCLTTLSDIAELCAASCSCSNGCEFSFFKENNLNSQILSVDSPLIHLDLLENTVYAYKKCRIVVDSPTKSEFNSQTERRETLDETLSILNLSKESPILEKANTESHIQVRIIFPELDEKNNSRIISIEPETKTQEVADFFHELLLCDEDQVIILSRSSDPNDDNQYFDDDSKFDQLQYSQPPVVYGFIRTLVSQIIINQNEIPKDMITVKLMELLTSQSLKIGLSSDSTIKEIKDFYINLDDMNTINKLNIYSKDGENPLDDAVTINELLPPDSSKEIVLYLKID